MAINANPPPWLQQAWTPREPYDPTPWLQERFRREVIRQELPVRVQGEMLRAQAAALEIEQRAMENELRSIEMGQYQTELPSVAEWMKGTNGDPLKILNNPSPNVTNPKLQQTILNAKKIAAESTYAQQVEKYQLGLTEAAAKLVASGKYVRPKLDESGRSYFDPEELAAAAGELNEEERAFVLQRVAAQTAWHTQQAAATTPQVQVIEGEQYLVNPKSGRFERLNKAPTKEQFIASNVAKWMEDRDLESTDEAGKQLGEFYDKYVASSPPSNKAPAPAPAPSAERVKVSGPDGKIYTVPASQLEQAKAKGYNPVQP